MDPTFITASKVQKNLKKANSDKKKEGKQHKTKIRRVLTEK
jgi:hypothetical protein